MKQMRFYDQAKTVLSELRERAMITDSLMGPLKKGIITLSILLVSGFAQLSAADANPPDRMTYQGYLVDNTGAALALTTPKNYDVIFRIYDASSAGNRLWSEQQTVTVDKGYFSVLLGEGSTPSGESRPNLSEVFSGATASDRFIAVSVKLSGTTFTDITPRLRLLPSPYSFLARNAVNLVNNSGTPLATVATGSLELIAPLNVSGPVVGASFTGNGANVTGINANNITSGTLNESRLPSIDARKLSGVIQDERLSGNVATLDGNQNFTGSKNFSGPAKFKTVEADTVSATTVNGNGTIPLGGIIMWSGATAPSGWALCDGGTYSGRQTPDLRGRFVLGMGNGPGLTGRGLNQKGGEENHTLSVAELPPHSHTVSVKTTGYVASYNGSSEAVTAPYNGKNNAWQDYGTSNTGSGSAHNNMPPYWVLAYIMRVQ